MPPFAFYPATTRQTIHDACYLTHQNEDAYAGALAVYLAIRAALRRTWTGRNNLLALLLPDLPDTNLSDRLRELSSYPPAATIAEAARLGNNGHAVNSVPFALFWPPKSWIWAWQLIATGGDTDTNASLAGQVAGALVGRMGLPPELLKRLAQLPEYPWIRDVLARTVPAT